MVLGLFKNYILNFSFDLKLNELCCFQNDEAKVLKGVRKIWNNLRGLIGPTLEGVRGNNDPWRPLRNENIEYARDIVWENLRVISNLFYSSYAAN